MLLRRKPFRSTVHRPPIRELQARLKAGFAGSQCLLRGETMDRVTQFGLGRSGYEERVLLEEGVSQEVMLALKRQEDEEGPVANLLDL